MAAAVARVNTTRLNQNFDPAAVTDLANALNKRDCYAEALGLHQKVLKFQRQHIGHDHPLVASSKNKYACLNRSVSSNVHPGCLVCSTATVLCKQGKVHEAISLLSQAHTIYQASYGP